MSFLQKGFDMRVLFLVFFILFSGCTGAYYYPDNTRAAVYRNQGRQSGDRVRIQRRQRDEYRRRQREYEYRRRQREYEYRRRQHEYYDNNLGLCRYNCY